MFEFFLKALPRWWLEKCTGTDILFVSCANRDIAAMVAFHSMNDVEVMQAKTPTDKAEVIARQVREYVK